MSNLLALQQTAGMSSEDVGRLIKLATADELQALDLLLAHDVIWRPQPGPQTMAYESVAAVIGYGGAAGGGKTDLAVGKSLTQFTKSAIFRREATQLTGIIDRVSDMLGTRDGLSSKDKIWRINPVRHPRVHQRIQLEFGSAPHAGDEKRYQGRPKQLLVLDETTEFLESQARFLMGWVRTHILYQRTQTLMTFNPPTSAEGRWVVKFFAPWLDDMHPWPAAPGELRHFAMIGREEHEVPEPDPFKHNGELVIPQSRTFIPSRVADNAYLIATGYVAQLQAMPEPLRSQMLYGDFNAGMEDNAFQVCPTAWVDAAMERWKERAPKGPMDSMGVDVARGGNDKTVIARRHGKWFDELVKIPGKHTPDGQAVTGQVIAHQRKNPPIHIDVIGVGSSPYDFLRVARQHVIGVNMSESATRTDRSGRLTFANMRTQIWWLLREALDPDNDTGIALPPDNELRSELCAPQFGMRGKAIAVEDRDAIIKRIGRSPDLGTAICLANIATPRAHDRHQSGGMQIGPAHEGGARGYDPYSDF